MEKEVLLNDQKREGDNHREIRKVHDHHGFLKMGSSVLHRVPLKTDN